MTPPLSRDEEDLAALLARTGLRGGAARCLALLLRGAPVSRRDAAAATGLALQDVSDAMRELEALGAARVEARSGGRPGRPSLRYHLAEGSAEVLARFETRRRDELARESAALDDLRERAAAL